MYPCPPIVTSKRSAIGHLRHYPLPPHSARLLPSPRIGRGVRGEGTPLVLPPGSGGAGGGRDPTSASPTGCPPPRRFAAAISRRCKASTIAPATARSTPSSGSPKSPASLAGKGYR